MIDPAVPVRALLPARFAGSYWAAGTITGVVDATHYAVDFGPEGVRVLPGSALVADVPPGEPEPPPPPPMPFTGRGHCVPTKWGWLHQEGETPAWMVVPPPKQKKRRF